MGHGLHPAQDLSPGGCHRELHPGRGGAPLRPVQRHRPYPGPGRRPGRPSVPAPVPAGGAHSSRGSAAQVGGHVAPAGGAGPPGGTCAGSGRFWLPCLTANENPHLVRHFVRQFVETKRRCQANDTSWNPYGGLNEAMVLSPVSIGQGVKSSPCAFQDSLTVKVREVPRMDVQPYQVPWTQNPFYLGQGQDLGGLGKGIRHSESIG